METWYQDYYSEKSEDSNTFGYILTSSFLHAAFFAAAVLVGSLMPKPEMPEVLEIEILSSPAPVFAEIPTPAKVLPAMPALPKAAPAPTKSVPIVVKKESSSSFEKEIAVLEKELAAAPKSAPKIRAASRAIVKGPTAPLSEVIAPTLETDEFESSLNEKVEVQDAKFNTDEISDDLNKVDQEQNAKIASLKQAMDQETNQAFNENENTLEDLKNQQLLADKAMAMKNAARYAGEMEALEKARADRLASEKAAALAAQAAAAQAKKNAQGTGGTKIRTLEELKQFPGNQRPAYASADRLARRQGEVSFLAYISRDGKPVQFKLIKSTGHATLDKKTLQAIRGWKFYPGQEGWVEIPFRWDLKGGPQEMPATLRRKISQF